MKNIYLLLFVLFCTVVSSKAQISYTSPDNFTGEWEESDTWTKSQSDGALTPDLNGWQNAANINGYITKESGVTMSNNSSLNIYDTLVIMGNLEPSGSNINISETGLLIVFGNITSSNKAQIINKGRVIVTGDYYGTGEANLDNQDSGEFYLYGNPDIDNMAVVDGCNSNEYKIHRTCDIAGSFKSPDDLQNDHPPLYDFVENGGDVPIQLPVNLLYFQLRTQTQGVEIKWASSKAWDFSHYELERSVDGRDFSFLASIGAKENTDWTEEYSYADAKPLNGTSYYRLKAVDIDGSFEYKGIEMVQFFGAVPLRVFPNPCTTGTLNIRHAHEGAVKVSLHDNSGRTAYAGTLQSSSKSIDVSALQSGMYILIIEGTTGIQKTQVIIQ